jgi:hypothetical protein
MLEHYKHYSRLKKTYVNHWKDYDC